MVKLNIPIFHGVHQSAQYHPGTKTLFKDPPDLPGNPHYFSCSPSSLAIFSFFCMTTVTLVNFVPSNLFASKFSFILLRPDQSQIQKFHENNNYIVIAAQANHC